MVDLFYFKRMKEISGWRWVPTLYLYQGIPYSIVMTTSALFYANMGISTASFTFWTSLLYLPWTIKPIWSPIVEAVSTKRNWVVATQLFVAAAFVLLGLSFFAEQSIFYPLSLVLLALIAFGSASHDIACDGFYMLALTTEKQSFFVGIRSTFYRIAMPTSLGALPAISGFVQENVGAENPVAMGWTVAIGCLGVFLLMLAVYNQFALPRPSDTTAGNTQSIFKEVIRSFFTKKGAVPAILFLLFYRLGEAQLAKIATPFLIDERQNGGLAMSLAQYGFAYGTAGMISLTVGGILGGWFASKYGLRRMLWWMVAFMNVPNFVYVALATFQPEPTSLWVYGSIIAEQFGYGFGFTAYMLFLINYVSGSRYKTAEYSIGTAIMALGMMLPGMISGWVSELLGYELFFVYVLICCIPGIVLTAFIPIIDEQRAEKI